MNELMKVLAMEVERGVAFSFSQSRRVLQGIGRSFSLLI